ELEDAVQVGGGNAPLGDRDRGLEHGQGHALAAVTEQREVALLDRVQAVVDVVEVDVVGDDRLEFRLRVAVVVLAAPERVVAVETDQPDGAVACHPASLGPTGQRVSGWTSGTSCAGMSGAAWTSNSASVTKPSPSVSVSSKAADRAASAAASSLLTRPSWSTSRVAKVAGAVASGTCGRSSATGGTCASWVMVASTSACCVAVWSCAKASGAATAAARASAMREGCFMCAPALVLVGI